MSRRITLSDVRDYCAIMVAISAVVGLFAVLPLALKVLWAVVVVAFFLLLMKRGGCFSRGKMDSHSRQHGASNGDPLGSRGGSQRGPNIDHSTLV